mmetsp:Transcript_15512/g.15434  ORF Transcript_15512/g.15434 Transcript_15512/m.15434 type:complete len:110 (-) Transcript_15512:722-1051(-)
MKYHTFTGLPMWDVELPAISCIVSSPYGNSIMVARGYSTGSGGAMFDSVSLPENLRFDDLETQKTGIYNADLSTVDGKGNCVLHSGGGSKDRLYDIVGDSSGNVYNKDF